MSSTTEGSIKTKENLTTCTPQIEIIPSNLSGVNSFHYSRDELREWMTSSKIKKICIFLVNAEEILY